MIKFLCIFVAVFGLWAGSAHSEEAAIPAREFQVRNNDVWVMVGDSITFQNHYPVYIEAFIRARYPTLKFSVVNSGKNDETFINGAIRFRTSVSPYKPTLISLCYGMEDHSRTFAGEQNFANDPTSSPQHMLDLACGTGAKVIVISATPVLAPEDFSTDGGKFQLTGKNTDARGLPTSWRSNPASKLFTQKLAELAANNRVQFIDQMTTLQAVWGMNYGRDRVIALRNAIHPTLEIPINSDNLTERSAAISAAILPFITDAYGFNAMLAPDKANLLTHWKATHRAKAGVWEDFRKYLVTWTTQVDAMNPPCVQLSGGTNSVQPHDIVHPNQAAHLMMAAVIVKQLGADGLVSEVTIDAPTSKITSSKKATVRDLTYANGTLTFKRLDESLPFPIEPAARNALDVDVLSPLGSPRDLFGMSRLVLKVTNMPAGKYEVLIDGYTIGTATSDELTQGFDAGLTKSGPIAAQTLKLVEAVRAGSVMAANVKEDEVAADRHVPPRVMEEATPVEHVWTVRQR